MGCIGVGSSTAATQIILDKHRCTILLVLLMPVIPATQFFFSDSRALKALHAADGLSWVESSY
jgi:hypothetical protein